MITKKINNMLIWLYSIPVNYKIFPREIAAKLPLRISYRTKCRGLYKGCIEIQSDKIYKGMIQFGMNQGSFGMESGKKSCLMFEENGKIIFHGNADFASTVSVRVFRNGILEIGKGVFSNSNLSLNASKRISIGDNAQFGWDVEIIDSDGHDIRDINNKVFNYDRDVVIGNNVWIGARASVLKGAKIADGCIVGYGSLVSGKFEEKDTVIAGTPAKVLKKDISWSREKTQRGMEECAN